MNINNLFDELRKELDSVKLKENILNEIEKLKSISEKLKKIHLSLNKELNELPISGLESEKEKIIDEISNLIWFLQEMQIILKKK